MYNDFIGTSEGPTDEQRELLDNRGDHSKYLYESGYDPVRFGIPSGVVNFKGTREERKILINHFLNHGYEGWPHTKISTSFKKHVAKFRVSLDMWEAIAQDRLMDKDEIYFRCLTEGHSFTEWVKKTRSTCYRAFTSETDTDIDPEYYSDRYTGYNSLLHERYLIHWDDREDVDDIKYAFIPPRKSHTKEFRKMVDDLFRDFRLDEIDFSSDIDMIGAIKNTKMYDPISGKTHLMREFWDSSVTTRGSYFAKRVVVPTSPGSTRDTGIGDSGTILKVKILNNLARQISDKLPYSANTDSIQANLRLKRVLKKNLFLHLDFKKFGLTFPRALINEFIRKIQDVSGIDLTHLLIENFYVEVDKEVYQTHRGTMLGWLDSINSLCVCAILHSLSKELGFDFITFNDDVEISKFGLSDQKGTLTLLRMGVISTMDYFDIPISLSKTFGSKASVFLERYAFYDQYGIDMFKDQLTVESYSKSCVTKEIWQAKFFHAAANQWTKNTYATDRCIDTCPVEFRKDEITLPLWSGGWFIYRENELDLSLQMSDRLGIRLGMELSKFHPPRYSTPRKKVSSNERIFTKVENLVYNSYSPESLLHHKGYEEVTIESINDEIEYLRQYARTAADSYCGRDQEWSSRVLSLVESQEKDSLGLG